MRGDTLQQGRYRLVGQLALPKSQQGQGVAWLASDKQSHHLVIVRQIVFPDDALEDARQEIRNIRERCMAVAQHTGFLKVIDIFHEQHRYYIVFFYPVGETLAELIKRQGGALPEHKVARYGVQLCEILEVFNRQKPPLVHGGISPETIVVSRDEDQVTLLHVPLFPRLARHNGKGPADYLAPEQMRGEAVPTSDMYALAATLYHAVTGYNPQEHLAFFHPPARRLNPTVTPHMESVLARGLRLSVAQRFAHISEMKEALSKVPSVAQTQQAPSGKPVLATSKDQRHQRSQQQHRRNLSITVAVGIAITLVFFSISLFYSFARQIFIFNSASTATVRDQAAFTQELRTEMQAYQKNGIGISDGRLIFDTYPGRSDVNLKRQAATALQQGDTSSAVNFVNQATNADPIDAEALIYAENMRLLQTGAPYVTIVLGMALDGSDIYLSSDRGRLQAAYLIQHKVNTTNILPHGLKLRLLIANSGSHDGDIATVAQFINNRVNQDGNPDHIIAVVGWPYSSQTTDALASIAGAHLPLVSQTASSVKLSGSSPYFFRVNPADDLQGTTMGTLVMQKWQAKKILVLRDPTDTYSDSLAEAFAARVHSYGMSLSQATFSETVTTVADYNQVIHTVIANHIDCIFLAGFDVDAIRLSHAVGNALRDDRFNPVLMNLKLVGGDAIGSNLLLGQGNNADAQIVREFPQDLRKLTFTSFADLNEWNFLHIPHNKQPDFFTAWVSTYQSSAMGDNAPSPDYDTLLTYDAVHVVVYAASYVNGSLSGQSVRDALASLGHDKKIPAFQGVTGRIFFDQDGNSINKAIVVLAVVGTGNSNSFQIQQLVGQFG
jgi:ABC-type branched-subunit amino acid transport system substrate-binding protein/serine/threonine protein kinase